MPTELFEYLYTSFVDRVDMSDLNKMYIMDLFSVHYAKNATYTDKFILFSIRILSARKQERITTILPPPIVSALNRIIDIAYSRYHSLFYILLNPKEIWIYTTR